MLFRVAIIIIITIRGGSCGTRNPKPLDFFDNGLN